MSPEAILSHGEAREFELPDGRTTHAFVYAPRSESNRAAAGERVPLLLKSHGGPTSAASSINSSGNAWSRIMSRIFRKRSARRPVNTSESS